VNYDYALVVTITVTCYSPSCGDHLFACGVIFWPPQALVTQKIDKQPHVENHWLRDWWQNQTKSN